MAFPNHGMQSHHELLEAQAHVWNHIFNFINSMSLKCALQLGIPDIIHKHGKPMTLSELVNTLPINKSKSQCIFRLMRMLIHSKFFIKIKISEEDEEGYWLTPASRLLLEDDPLSLKPFALTSLDPIFIDPWNHMSEWFQDDKLTPFATVHGETVWVHSSQDPRSNELFNEAMASDTRLVNQILIETCKQVFVGLKSMVDVGGGKGVAAKFIADAFPGLKCVVLDLPHVIAGSEESDNLTFVGGDMFESIPEADAVFFKWILHDWSDEECVQILKKCKEAIPSKDNGGKVIIIDMVVDDEKGDGEAFETQLLLDMEMMNQTTGKERNVKEWAKVFFDAGFTSYKITPALGLRSVIEVFP